MDYSSEEEFDNYINEHDEHSIINTRKVIRDFQDPFDYYSSEEFRRRYRFTKDVVHFVLLPLINKDLEKLTARGLPVPPLYQLLVSLRFYASGSFQMITGDLISISQPTVSRIVKRVSHLFCLKVREFIKFPNNLQRIKEDFYVIASFPGIIGAVDGTHIPIRNPGGPYAEVFRNRKKFFSINTQVVCGPNLEIFDIVADRPGSVHDNRIFLASSLKRKMEQGIIDGILLGDSGYGCQRYLLTPVAQPENNSEENYNKAHIKTRNTVERTIGVWKRIFPCLSKKMATNLTTSCNVIVATAVLYNICRAHGVIEHIEPDNRNIQRTTRNVQQSRETREGLLFRRLFISRHF
ncbi:putative nuclease HARBI1 isoform X2 [Amyelois transitella]|uniref:putative nuclease HARBI1 isoform X2 n=1 Tax=Amyelois transitella TaxID=680683 RepID=UPI0029901CC7|nr:putative nuclease HARBI1 isoform X2 [Amyelois transitella]